MTRVPDPVHPPRHHWTEDQTCHLLRLISAKQAYRTAFFPPPRLQTTDTKYKLQRELCLDVLEDTAWMDWMEQRGCVQRLSDAQLVGTKIRQDTHDPVSNRIRGMAKEAVHIRALLGPVRSIEDAVRNSTSQAVWKDFERSRKYTWYFLWLDLRLASDPGWLDEVATAGTRLSPSLQAQIPPAERKRGSNRNVPSQRGTPSTSKQRSAVSSAVLQQQSTTKTSSGAPSSAPGQYSRCASNETRRNSTKTSSRSTTRTASRTGQGQPDKRPRISEGSCAPASALSQRSHHSCDTEAIYVSSGSDSVSSSDTDSDSGSESDSHSVSPSVQSHRSVRTLPRSSLISRARRAATAARSFAAKRPDLSGYLCGLAANGELAEHMTTPGRSPAKRAASESSDDSSDSEDADVDERLAGPRANTPYFTHFEPGMFVDPKIVSHRVIPGRVPPALGDKSTTTLNDDHRAHQPGDASFRYITNSDQSTFQSDDIVPHGGSLVIDDRVRSDSPITIFDSEREEEYEDMDIDDRSSDDELEKDTPHSVAQGTKALSKHDKVFEVVDLRSPSPEPYLNGTVQTGDEHFATSLTERYTLSGDDERPPTPPLPLGGLPPLPGDLQGNFIDSIDGRSRDANASVQISSTSFNQVSTHPNITGEQILLRPALAQRISPYGYPCNTATFGAGRLRDKLAIPMPKLVDRFDRRVIAQGHNILDGGAATRARSSPIRALDAEPSVATIPKLALRLSGPQSQATSMQQTASFSPSGFFGQLTPSTLLASLPSPPIPTTPISAPLHNAQSFIPRTKPIVTTGASSATKVSRLVDQPSATQDGAVGSTSIPSIKTLLKDAYQRTRVMADSMLRMMHAELERRPSQWLTGIAVIFPGSLPYCKTIIELVKKVGGQVIQNERWDSSNIAPIPYNRLYTMVEEQHEQTAFDQNQYSSRVHPTPIDIAGLLALIATAREQELSGHTLPTTS